MTNSNPGLLQRFQNFMTPERALQFQGLGMGLSQIAAGAPVNLSPVLQLQQERQRAEQMRSALEGSGAMEQFSPQQRAILASMEPSAAQRVIASVLFREPEPTPERRIIQGADGFNYYTDTGERVLPDVQAPVEPMEAPRVQTLTRDDGSEVAVQWDAARGTWVPLDAPEGGGTAETREKLTESQSQKVFFQTMQQETGPVLDQMEMVFDPANLSDAVARRTPIAGNFFQSAQGQQYEAAAAVWAEGALRLATGAAATQPEIERTVGTYFARPGDTPETVMFKSALRAMYSRAIARSLGEGGGNQRLILPTDFAEAINMPTPNSQPIPDVTDAERQSWIDEINAGLGE